MRASDNTALRTDIQRESGALNVQRALIAFFAGAGSALAFAPFEVFPVAFASLAVLVVLVRQVRRPRAGFLIGFAWGLGAFLAGVSWLYVALQRFGGMPVPLAGFAIALFCAYLALFPGGVAALFVRLRPRGAFAGAAIFAGLWIFSEGLRGWLLTGFPWLAIGYSQTPPSPLAGFVPAVGVYGVGGLVAFAAALLALSPWRSRFSAVGAAAALLLIGGVGFALGQVGWTTPVGEPLRVALVQTNIEQSLKWRPERLSDWLDVNARLADQPDADLVVLPETTLPLLVEQLPEGYLAALAERARERDSDLVLGIFSRDASGNVFNSALSVGRSPASFYAKQHLVPFGEYSPPLFDWFYRFAQIPMSDQTPGPRRQAPMALGAQRVAINICYEDLFGRELLRALPEATLMLNLSNLAWYGASFAQPQHLQIARVRALETGRPMLRATNTGMTALVQPDGRVEDVLAQFERGVLRTEVTGYQGMTPYARWGDLGAWLLAAVALAFGILRGRARLRDD